MIERRINKKELSEGIFGEKIRIFVKVVKSRQTFIDLMQRNCSKIMAILSLDYIFINFNHTI
jgi:hypothetical protein